MFFLSCVCYAIVHVCLYMPCGHLLGKGWPLGSRLWCLLWVFTFPLVSWVRCGTWLYRFMVLAPLLLQRPDIADILDNAFFPQGVRSIFIPPPPPFLNILWKWTNLVFNVSMRSNYFIFMGYLENNVIKSAKPTPNPLYIWIAFQKSWIRPCNDMLWDAWNLIKMNKIFIWA